MLRKYIIYNIENIKSQVKYNFWRWSEETPGGSRFRPVFWGRWGSRHLPSRRTLLVVFNQLPDPLGVALGMAVAGDWVGAT